MNLRVLTTAVGGAVLVLALLQAPSAVAVPTTHNRNAEPADVSCGDPIGAVTVLTMGDGRPAFLPDGQVTVGLRDSGDATYTVTTFDGEVSVGPFFESFEASANGRGFEDRLITCPFTGTFTDSFVLTPRTAAFLGIPEQYVGTRATAEGTAAGTAWVVIPGN